MPFTDEEKRFTEILCKEKRYGYRKFIRKFPNKNWIRHGLDHLIKTISGVASYGARPVNSSYRSIRHAVDSSQANKQANIKAVLPQQ